MSRTLFPFFAGDISALARSLNHQLTARPEPPGHVELLNMLARAVGCRNFQHFRARHLAGEQLEALAGRTPEPVDTEVVLRVARCFDGEGRLTRWPSKPSHQKLALWAIWARLPADTPMTEPQINALIAAAHRFGDHALIRRELCDYKMVRRTTDCREYRRIEQAPSPEGRAVIRQVRGR